MHTVWKGTFRIAKLQIPVKLYAANEDQDISFKQLHRDCGQSVSHLKYCTKCDKPLEKEQIQRAYDLGGGRYVEIADDDLKPSASTADRCMVLEHFIDSEDFDPIYLKKHYYVGPEKVGQQAFQLLQTSLQESNRIGIGYIILRSAEYLAAIRAMKDGIALSTLYFADEVRSPKSLYEYDNALSNSASHDALTAINQLVSNLTVRFDHESYENRHHQEVVKVINSKMNNQIIPLEPPNIKVHNEEESMMDIVAAIQRSIESVGSVINPPIQEGLH